MSEENVVYTGDCQKYRVPPRCYRANDWASGGALIEATAEVYFVTDPKPNMCVRIRDKKSDAVWNCDAFEDTVLRSEDSDRYFVIRVSADETIGVGFASSQESAKFVEALEPAIPAIQVYSAPGHDADGAGGADGDESVACVTPVKVSNYYARPVSPYMAVRTQEPEISFDETSVHATKASAFNINAESDNTEEEEEENEEAKEKDNVTEKKDTGENKGLSEKGDEETIEKPIEPKEHVEHIDKNDTSDETENKDDKVETDEDTTKEEKEDEQQQTQQTQQTQQKKKKVTEEGEEEVRGTRRHRKEDNSQIEWRRHRKHIFVLSIAGKPIYSRFGDEQLLAPFMASLMALVSFVEDCKDSIRYFVAGDWQIVFHVRGPVIAVCVCSTEERRTDLERALFYVHSQLAAVLTFGTITKIFSRRPDFDLRSLLSPGDITLLDNVVHRVNREPGIMLDAVEPLRMPRALRASVEAAVAAAACPELLFAFLFSGFNLIHMARPRRFSLRAADVHLLMNFVASSDAFRSSCVWTPICLPLFDNKGFLHAHIGYIADGVALVLISSHVDAFYKINECATVIARALAEDGGALDQLSALCAPKPSQQQGEHEEKKGVQPQEPGRYPMATLHIPHLRHFVYKSLTHVQITTPTPGLPDGCSRARTKALLRLYQWARSQVTRPASGELAPAALPPHKIYYRISSDETIMACFTKSYEIYAAFSPLVKKKQALAACNAISSFVSENEDELFVKPATW